MEDEKVHLRRLEKKVHKLIKERHDHKAYYYLPVSAKNIRLSQKHLRDIEAVTGDE